MLEMKIQLIINKNGFTLVEVLLSVLISTIVMAAITMSLRSGLQSSVGIDTKVSAQQDTRAALEIMAMEIGMASYKLPIFGNNIWRNPANCNAESNNLDRRGIQIANSNSITVQMDINDNGEISPPNNPNETIEYIYDASNQRITRSTNCGPHFDLIGCVDANGDGRCDNNGSLRTVRVINDAATPVFRYFYGNGVPFTPNPTLTTCDPITPNRHICNIRRIDITLLVESDIIDPMTKQRGRMIYSTSVIPRNHPPR